MNKRQVALHWGGMLTLVLVLPLAGCSKPEITGKAVANRPPETRLANIPPENDSAHPYPYRLTFTWDGGDEDGTVVGFRYRWDGHAWSSTTARSGTFSFESPAAVNRHTFEVKAVDNEGAEDPTPASRTFFTSQNLFPETEIVVGPPDGSEVFSLATQTETWHGVEFQLHGSDSDGSIVGYEYALDDTAQWSFTAENAVRLFGIAGGAHTFFARAVDDASGKDAQPAQRHFTAVIPTFDRGILVIDETRDGSGAKGSPSDEQVDRFYRNILTGNGRNFTEWDRAKQGPPKAADLAPYSLLLWHGDDRAEQLIRTSLDVLKDYLNVGGKLWLVGWRIIPELDSFVGAATHIYRSGEFGQAYLHLASYSEQADFDFTGATGISGYPDLDLDAAKLLDSFRGKLSFIGVMTPQDAEPVLAFKSSTGSGFQNHPCAVRYIGSTFKVVAFAFPLYFGNESQATSVAGKVLSDLGE